MVHKLHTSNQCGSGNCEVQPRQIPTLSAGQRFLICSRVVLSAFNAASNSVSF
ncbi:hypothetical protein [Acinetobacter baumannii]|uniref:hypothetical protein n=1 Tax=Acinetobacter baumannii TaxID=470 RepID=UPI0035CF0F91